MMWPAGGSLSAGDVCHGFVCLCVMGLCDKCVMYLLQSCYDVAGRWFFQCWRCVSWICLLLCHGYV